MTDQPTAIPDTLAWVLIGAAGWLLLHTAARALGDWAIRWRTAGRHGKHATEEAK